MANLPTDRSAADPADDAAAHTADHNTLHAFHNLIDAAGDLIVGTGVDTAGKLAKGAAQTVLRVNAAGTALEYFDANAAYRTLAASAARATSAVNQSIPNGAFTVVAFETESFDSGTMHDLVTNNSRLTVPAGKAGKWAVTGTVMFATNSTGIRAVQIRKNGATAFGQVNAMNAGAANFSSVNVSDVLDLAVGDYVELLAYQDSGVALNTSAASTYFAFAYQGV